MADVSRLGRPVIAGQEPPPWISVDVMLRRVLLVAIRLYQVCVSPLLGQHCRFEPSCSTYAAQALERHGLGRGLWRGLRRIARCHPLHPGGYDPVA